jgi:hypothetical protein
MTKALILIHLDGSSIVGPIVPIDFSVRDWVNSRLSAFNMLGIGSIREVVLSPSEEPTQ